MPDLPARFATFLMGVPPHMRESVSNYVSFGCPVGGFLTALLSGASVAEVVKLADQHNQRYLAYWGHLLSNGGFPPDAHGSPDAVTAWIAKGGLEGKPVDA